MTEYNLLKRYTKAITTIGPSSNNVEQILELINNGSTCLRMNFSHGDYEEHSNRLRNAKEAIAKSGLPVGIMLDTKGPEIRTNDFVNGKIEYKSGDKVKIYFKKEILGNKEEFSIEYKHLDSDVQKGSEILLDDGKLVFEVISINSEYALATAKNTHIVKNRRGVNLPGTKLSLDFLSQKDKLDLKFACDNNYDFIAASFVRNAKDVQHLRKYINQFDGGKDIKIISKIECTEAVEKYEEILQESDLIMFARGDLGIEIPFYKVPKLQKDFLKLAQLHQKPFIVATQMLDSMTNNPAPTRAEVSDVFWAVELGASSTMLSGESANGDYPVKSINTMARIAIEAEQSLSNRVFRTEILSKIPPKYQEISDKVLNQGINNIFCINNSYSSVAKIASLHLPCQIIFITNNKKDYAFSSILYGVKSILVDKIPQNDEKIYIAEKIKNNRNIITENIKSIYIKKGF